MRRLWRASVWAPETIDPDDHKSRWMVRVWVPAYLACVLLAAIGVIRYGSPVLDKTFPDEFVDVLGWTLGVAAVLAWAGVTFPRLWAVELAGHLTVVTMVGTYGGALLFASESPSSREFLSWLVIGGVWMSFSRLTWIGEQIKERREDTA